MRGVLAPDHRVVWQGVFDHAIKRIVPVPIDMPQRIDFLDSTTKPVVTIKLSTDKLPFLGNTLDAFRLFKQIKLSDRKTVFFGLGVTGLPPFAQHGA